MSVTTKTALARIDRILKDVAAKRKTLARPLYLEDGRCLVLNGAEVYRLSCVTKGTLPDYSEGAAPLEASYIAKLNAVLAPIDEKDLKAIPIPSEKALKACKAAYKAYGLKQKSAAFIPFPGGPAINVDYLIDALKIIYPARNWYYDPARGPLSPIFITSWTLEDVGAVLPIRQTPEARAMSLEASNISAAEDAAALGIKAPAADPAPAPAPEAPAPEADPAPAPEALAPAPAPAADPAPAPEALAPAPDPVPDPVPDPAPVPADYKAARGPVPEKTFIGQQINGRGWKIIFDAETARTRVIFDAVPPAAVRAAVKEAGFYYSPRLKSWNKGLNFRAERAARALAVQLKTFYA